jgi:hypothetical protein
MLDLGLAYLITQPELSQAQCIRPGHPAVHRADLSFTGSTVWLVRLMVLVRFGLVGAHQRVISDHGQVELRPVLTERKGNLSPRSRP